MTDTIFSVAMNATGLNASCELPKIETIKVPFVSLPNQTVLN